MNGVSLPARRRPLTTTSPVEARRTAASSIERFAGSTGYRTALRGAAGPLRPGSRPTIAAWSVAAAPTGSSTASSGHGHVVPSSRAKIGREGSGVLARRLPVCYGRRTVTISRSGQPAAWDLAAIVDADRYPLDDLESPAGRALVERCRAELVEAGACELPGFLRPEAVRRAVAEALELKPLAHRSVVIHTIDLGPADAASDQEDPLRRGYRTAKATLAYDRVPEGSVLRAIYESDLVSRFIGSALEIDPIYRMADELGAMNVMYHDPGDELAWHFDNADFAVTLMLQPADRGGVFEFVRMLRTPADPNPIGVRRLLTGHADGARTLQGAAGTLALFRGRLSPHRVTVAEGARPRINAVLSYAPVADARLTSSARALFYGR